MHWCSRWMICGFALVAVGVAGAQPMPEKKVAFEMRAVPWKRVLEWLTDHSGLPLVSAHPPPGGSFTFISPLRGKEPATYTTAEIIDLLNEQLQTDKYLLIRRVRALHLIVADDVVDANLVPLIDVAELPKRGRTELVSISLPLQKVGGADGAKDLPKLMGPFGSAVVLPKVDRVVLQDTAGNLRKICKITGAEPPPPAAKSEPKKEEPAKPARKDDPANVILRYVFLTEIFITGKDAEAVIRDRATNTSARLRVSKDYVPLTFLNLEDDTIKTTVRIKVIRIEPREVHFQAGDRDYVIRIGENMKEALERKKAP